jgi:hypothetical protein
MADEPPKLTVVAETDPADVEKALAERELSWETREMAANLLRIIRGAGKPQLLPQQIIDLSEQILETSKSARAWAVWSAMEDVLHSALPDAFDALEREEALRMIAKGSLQYAASRLVYQAAQEGAGRDEIVDGIERRERVIERYQEKLRAEQAAYLASLSRPARKPAKRKKRAAPKAKTAPAIQPSPAPTFEKPRTTAEFMKQRQRQLRDES